MRYFLGFDAAKLKLDLSLVDESGVELWHDKVANDEVILTELLLTLAGEYDGVGNILTAVVEATGRYHYPLLDASLTTQVPCLVYNPLLTKQGIKASVRSKKTDRTDALLIARLGLRGEGRVYTRELYPVTKLHARSYQKLGMVDGVVSRHVTHLTAMSGDNLSETVQAVFAAVRDSITTARKALYKELAKSADGPAFTRLQTIPGIGPYIAASLIGEIQAMERFSSGHALVAYAGLDPKIRQSGKSLNSTGRLSKRGSSYLRRSVFIAANVARQHDPVLKALYDKKRDEGKGYKVATVVVARKLLTIVRAVWLSGENYDPLFGTGERLEKG
jgi:transposase